MNNIDKIAGRRFISCFRKSVSSPGEDFEAKGWSQLGSRQVMSSGMAPQGWNLDADKNPSAVAAKRLHFHWPGVGPGHRDFKQLPR